MSESKRRREKRPLDDLNETQQQHSNEKKRKNGLGNPESPFKATFKEQPIPTDRPVRVYADGIYDLFHFGHARSLEQAKKLFPNTYLIVGVCNDELTHRLKGRTVMNDKERAESLRHCRWVDEVVENAPWIVTQEFIDKHKIDFVSHGEDPCLDADGNDIYQFVKDQGKFRTIKRTDGISTSDLILRIVKDYDTYVRRNFKRGYTGKQMNVGFVKEKQLQVEDKLNKLKQKVRDRVDGLKDWHEHHIMEFMKKFGGHVERLVSPFKNSRDDLIRSSDDELGFSDVGSPSTSPATSPRRSSGTTSPDL